MATVEDEEVESAGEVAEDNDTDAGRACLGARTPSKSSRQMISDDLPLSTPSSTNEIMSAALLGATRGSNS